jgi:hypothetical protein
MASPSWRVADPDTYLPYVWVLPPCFAAGDAGGADPTFAAGCGDLTLQAGDQILLMRPGLGAGPLGAAGAGPAASGPTDRDRVVRAASHRRGVAAVDWQGSPGQSVQVVELR